MFKKRKTWLVILAAITGGLTLVNPALVPVVDILGALLLPAEAEALGVLR